MNKMLQLFILPYAGGSVANFKQLTSLIDERIDAITVEYSGRGERSKETLASSFDEMLDDTVCYIEKKRNHKLPFAIMGYSMGCILAYEILANRMLVGEPMHLFIAAEVPPHDRALRLRQVDDPTEEIVLEKAKELGGLDERLLKNERFADIYIRPMISDYRNFFLYKFKSFDCIKKIRVNTSFFYCEKDTALEDMKKWSELIEGDFVFCELGDNHFFINSNYKEMASVINEKLIACIGVRHDI